MKIVNSIFEMQVFEFRLSGRSWVAVVRSVFSYLYLFRSRFFSVFLLWSGVFEVIDGASIPCGSSHLLKAFGRDEQPSLFTKRPLEKNK